MQRPSWFANAGLVLASTLVVGAASARAEPWRFGIIADTQWTKPDDGMNPSTCAAAIIKQVDQQFISAGVKLVIAVGDTVDVGSKVSIDTRALYAQDLYNAGIGFYPLRGNHEAAEDPNYLLSGLEFQYAFPQIGTGVNNILRPDITTAIIPAADLAANAPAQRVGGPFTVGQRFSSPVWVNATNNAISYSFDYNSARFVLLDQFDMTGNYYNSTISAQQPWIDGQLSDSGRPPHAFVFSHKNLLGGSHKDNLFGGPANANDPGDGSGVDTSTLTSDIAAALASKRQAMDTFISSLASNDVRLVISGHDHHHKLSVVSAPITPGMAVRQLIAQSDSSKFYKPTLPVSANDLPVAEDLYRVGYYIVTVDGPHVTIDYFGTQDTYPSAFDTTPSLNFLKLGSFSYSLNGREFVVPQGGSYASVHDRFHGTTARILGGTNGSAATDIVGRKLNKLVETGWTGLDPRDLGRNEVPASGVLILSGLADLGATQTDVYALSLSYDAAPEGDDNPLDITLSTLDETGNWVDATSANVGGTKRFVQGPWVPGYGLGTYGVDPDTHTAWAVLNHEGRFAVVGAGDTSWWNARPPQGTAQSIDN